LLVTRQTIDLMREFFDQSTQFGDFLLERLYLHE
jgi:hypothetical protein